MRNKAAVLAVDATNALIAAQDIPAKQSEAGALASQALQFRELADLLTALLTQPDKQDLFNYAKLSIVPSGGGTTEES